MSNKETETKAEEEEDAFQANADEIPLLTDSTLPFLPSTIDVPTFCALLNCYNETVEAVARRKATEKVLGKKKTRSGREERAADADDIAIIDIATEAQREKIEKEVDAFLELDTWRYDVLPGEVGESGELGKEELVRLVEWKLKHGIFRPTLLGMVKANQVKVVRKASSTAFASLAALRGSTSTKTSAAAEEERKDGESDTEPKPDLFPKQSLLDITTPIRGVGVAAASLVLSVGTAAAKKSGTAKEEMDIDVPFYSDDTFLWLCKHETPFSLSELKQESEAQKAQLIKGRAANFKRSNGELNVKYNMQEYRQLWEAVEELRTRLTAALPEKAGGGKFSCADVEKVAFVLRHIEESGFDGQRITGFGDLVAVDRATEMKVNVEPGAGRSKKRKKEEGNGQGERDGDGGEEGKKKPKRENKKETKKQSKTQSKTVNKERREKRDMQAKKGGKK